MEQDDPRHLLAGIAEILNRLGIPYLVSGGMAVAVWGRPRFTADIDIVVELRESQLDVLARELRTFRKDGHIDKEMMVEALRRKDEFNYIDGATGIKVDFWILTNDPFDASRLTRRVSKEIAGEQVYFTSPEDLILIKLKWYRESDSSRQKEDAESIVKMMEDELDMNYLKRWATELGVADLLKELLKRYTPPIEKEIT
mgnify:FL=1